MDPTVSGIRVSIVQVIGALAEPLTIGRPAELPADREEPRVRALLELARQGDRRAFGDLVAMHGQPVFRTAMAALGSAEDAEDAAQDAFVVAWRKLPTFRGDSTFRTWLLTIVWRKALDRRRIRRLWRTRRRSTDPDGSDALADLTAPAATPEERAVSRDLLRRIRAEIRRLPPKLRDVLLLAASGEHSYDEIALMLRIPVGTVKWRVAEARRVIRGRLQT